MARVPQLWDPSLCIVLVIWSDSGDFVTYGHGCQIWQTNKWRERKFVKIVLMDDGIILPMSGIRLFLYQTYNSFPGWLLVNLVNFCYIIKNAALCSRIYLIPFFIHCHAILFCTWFPHAGIVVLSCMGILCICEFFIITAGVPLFKRILGIWNDCNLTAYHYLQISFKVGSYVALCQHL